ncbi:hypothetical protein CKA32_001430 [Geitlerinema sp. FC II]|nr:hypothetical protein CKA32_001430 [Geitlerinema sp. FC II]
MSHCVSIPQRDFGEFQEYRRLYDKRSEERFQSLKGILVNFKIERKFGHPYCNRRFQSLKGILVNFKINA